jgi:hypothetical protein
MTLYYRSGRILFLSHNWFFFCHRSKQYNKQTATFNPSLLTDEASSKTEKYNNLSNAFNISCYENIFLLLMRIKLF